MDKTYIDKLALIYILNNKILVTKSRGKDTWYIPGGKREGIETDQEALLREVKEELSVDLITNSITPYGVFEAQAHGKPEGTIVRMTCFTARFTGTLQPGSEIEELEFFKYENKFKCSLVDHLIFDDLKMKNIIE